jgi:hypothetical protein
MVNANGDVQPVHAHAVTTAAATLPAGHRGRRRPDLALHPCPPTKAELAQPEEKGRWSCDMPDDAHDSLVRSLEQARLPGPGGNLTRPGSSYGKPLLAKTHRGRPRPPFECIALVLQGGGALGA